MAEKEQNKRTRGRPESPEVAAALPAIEALRAQGHGYRAIAKRLNLMGVRPAQSSQWGPGTIRAILVRHEVP